MQPNMTQTARAVQAQGRGKDSMLVHMSPREVRGLQALALANGGYLTINPQTGLPEAGFLEDLLPTLAGVALTVGSGGAIDPFTAAMIVGGGTTVATGDINKGLMAGLGAYGGAGLGSGVSAAGSTATPGLAPTTTSSYVPSVSTQAATTPTIGQNFAQAGQGFTNLATGQEGSFSKFIGEAANASTGAPATGMGGTMGTAKTIGSLVAPAAFQQPTMPSTKTEESNYEGPYTPTPREVRFPTPEQQAQLGTSEFTYFTPSNPVPGFQPFSPTTPPAQFAPPVMPPITSVAAMSDEEQRRRMGTTYMAQGGIAALARGRRETRKGMPPRFLAGGGDGMSDSIPAVIDNKQPARLADGEFVVPADVVSHLGNGSSKAGAKKLYAMMDRVRQARTGKKRQAPEINMRRMMPA